MGIWGKWFDNTIATAASGRRDRASLGHPGVRHAKLQDRCGVESAGGEFVVLARVIDVRQYGRRVNYGVVAAIQSEINSDTRTQSGKSIGATGKSG